MRLLYSLRSTLEALGLFFIIMLIYYICEQPTDFLPRDYAIAGFISVALIWIENKSFRWMAEHFEVEECPFCGAMLEWEEVNEDDN